MTKTTKQLISVGFVIIFSALLIVSCTWAELKVKMQFAPKVGDVYHLSMVMEQEIKQTLMDEEMTMNQTIGFGFSYTATAIDENGNVVIDVQYEWVQVKQTSPNGEMTYDSRNPSEEVDQAALAFGALVGKGFSMKVSPAGEVLEISGLDTMITALLDDMKLEDQALRAQMEEQLKKQYNEEALKEQFGSIIVKYPEGEAKIGDTWTASVKSSSIVPLAVETTYTLTGYKDGIATIGASSTISTDSENSETDMGMYKIQYNLSGTQEGTIEVDTEIGWSVSSVITQTVTGEMTLSMETEEITVPVTIQSVAHVEMEEE